MASAGVSLDISLNLVSDEDEETPLNISILDGTDEENDDTSNETDKILTRMDLIKEMRKSGHSFIDTKKQQEVLFEFVKSKLSLDEEKI
jgi:hypothetical protein